MTEEVWETPAGWDPSQGLMTGEEVSRVFRVDEKTVSKWARNRMIPAIRPGGHWRFSRAWVNEHMGENVDG